jgi:hypothetical protein
VFELTAHLIAALTALVRQNLTATVPLLLLLLQGL